MTLDFTLDASSLFGLLGSAAAIVVSLMGLSIKVGKVLHRIDAIDERLARVETQRLG